KGSLLGKMPGDKWQQLANLRVYYTFMWTHPGRKLLFMGGEVAQRTEWNHDAYVDWDALRDSGHAGIQLMLRDLNALYKNMPTLHELDGDPSGFSWVIGDDQINSVFAFERHAQNQVVLVVCNFTPVPRHAYRVGAARPGQWKELFNSDAAAYGGSNVGNNGY